MQGKTLMHLWSSNIFNSTYFHFKNNLQITNKYIWIIAAGSWKALISLLKMIFNKYTHDMLYILRKYLKSLQEKHNLKLKKKKKNDKDEKMGNINKILIIYMISRAVV